MPTTPIIIETSDVPPPILASQLLVFKIEDLTDDDISNFLIEADKNIDKDYVC